MHSLIASYISVCIRGSSWLQCPSFSIDTMSFPPGSTVTLSARTSLPTSLAPLPCAIYFMARIPAVTLSTALSPTHTSPTRTGQFVCSLLSPQPQNGSLVLGGEQMLLPVLCSQSYHLPCHPDRKLGSALTHLDACSCQVQFLCIFFL